MATICKIVIYKEHLHDLDGFENALARLMDDGYALKSFEVSERDRLTFAVLMVKADGAKNGK